jgi:hypothetical protein
MVFQGASTIDGGDMKSRAVVFWSPCQEGIETALLALDKGLADLPLLVLTLGTDGLKGTEGVK